MVWKERNNNNVSMLENMVAGLHTYSTSWRKSYIPTTHSTPVSVGKQNKKGHFIGYYLSDIWPENYIIKYILFMFN
jgi:hypothetical protein